MKWQMLAYALWAMGCSGTSLSVPNDATVSTEDAALPADADPRCQRDWEAVYGVPFNASTPCIPFGSRDAYVFVGCIPIERTLSGALSCYARPTGDERVITPYIYPWLTDQGWIVCPRDMAEPPFCR